MTSPVTRFPSVRNTIRRCSAGSLVQRISRISRSLNCPSTTPLDSALSPRARILHSPAWCGSFGIAWTGSTPAAWRLSARRPVAVEAVVRELVDVSSSGASRRMADTGSHVLQAELIAGEPGDLVDDAPGAREVRYVDL